MASAKRWACNGLITIMQGLVDASMEAVCRLWNDTLDVTLFQPSVQSPPAGAVVVEPAVFAIERHVTRRSYARFALFFSCLPIV